MTTTPPPFNLTVSKSSETLEKNLEKSAWEWPTPSTSAHAFSSMLENIEQSQSSSHLMIPTEQIVIYLNQQIVAMGQRAKEEKEKNRLELYHNYRQRVHALLCEMIKDNILITRAAMKNILSLGFYPEGLLYLKNRVMVSEDNKNIQQVAEKSKATIIGYTSFDHETTLSFWDNKWPILEPVDPQAWQELKYPDHDLLTTELKSYNNPLSLIADAIFLSSDVQWPEPKMSKSQNAADYFIHVLDDVFGQDGANKIIHRLFATCNFHSKVFFDCRLNDIIWDLLRHPKIQELVLMPAINQAQELLLNNSKMFSLKELKKIKWGRECAEMYFASWMANIKDVPKDPDGVKQWLDMSSSGWSIERLQSAKKVLDSTGKNISVLYKKLYHDLYQKYSHTSSSWNTAQKNHHFEIMKEVKKILPQDVYQSIDPKTYFHPSVADQWVDLNTGSFLYPLASIFKASTDQEEEFDVCSIQSRKNELESLMRKMRDGIFVSPEVYQQFCQSRWWIESMKETSEYWMYHAYANPLSEKIIIPHHLRVLHERGWDKNKDNHKSKSRVNLSPEQEAIWDRPHAFEEMVVFSFANIFSTLSTIKSVDQAVTARGFWGDRLDLWDVLKYQTALCVDQIQDGDAWAANVHASMSQKKMVELAMALELKHLCPDTVLSYEKIIPLSEAEEFYQKIQPVGAPTQGHQQSSKHNPQDISYTYVPAMTWQKSVEDWLSNFNLLRSMEELRKELLFIVTHHAKTLFLAWQSLSVEQQQKIWDNFSQHTKYNRDKEKMSEELKNMFEFTLKHSEKSMLMEELSDEIQTSKSPGPKRKI